MNGLYQADRPVELRSEDVIRDRVAGMTRGEEMV
jgi:hypothetical protein